MSSSTEPIADFFDRECCAAPGGAPVAGAARGTAEMVLDALTEKDLTGRSVLEIGSGDGSLSRALAARGAASVSGLDLSPASVEAARKARAEAAQPALLSYQVADAAEAPLAEFDIVLSEKVFCCYPQPGPLLANTLPAARRLYVLVLPESRGVRGLLAKLAIAAENGLQRLRRDPFRAHVHDVRAIQATIEQAGFNLRASALHWAWLLLVFERADVSGQSPS